VVRLRHLRFLAVIIGQQFFSSHDPVVDTLSSLAVFAVGFFFRPLGAFIFGAIGDRWGRRTSLAISITAMGAATFLAGFLPTYAQIGVAAPLLLVVIRCVQGLSTGGEWTGASSYLIEGAPQGKRARYGSLIAATAGFATAFGSLFGFILLGSLITVMDQTRCGPAVPDRHLQGIDDQFGPHVVTIAQPTIRRENTSSTTARYSHPSPVGTYVMSAVQTQFGALAVKPRFTRSSGGTTARSRRVSPRRRRWCTP
jgi:hypothetical protein